jgi:hypothetical protein
MALPFLLSLGLPALGAATGGLGLGLGAASLAGIGAGLGSFLQTGDVGKGIQTGLIAGLGGKLMSSATNALGGAGAQASTEALTAGGLPAATGSKFINATLGKDLLTKKLGETTVAGALGAAGSGFGTGLIADAMNPPTFKMSEKEKVDIPPPMPRIRSYQPKKNMGSTAEEEMITYYNPMQAGIMTNASTNYAKGGIVSEEMNEKDVIVEAVKAVKGLSDAPEVALGIFLKEYGEEALRDLVDKVQSGVLDDTIERFAKGDKGMVNGPGDGSGEDDMVEATMDREQDVLLTDGEFVLKEESTDAITKAFGGGFLDEVNDAGKDAPKKLKEKVAVA